MINIAHIASVSPHRINGPRSSVSNLSYHLDKINGVQSDFYSINTQEQFVHNKTPIYPIDRIDYESYDYIVFASIYFKEFIKISKKCRNHGIPYIITPRGGLVKQVTKKSFLKKWFYLNIYAKKFINNASAIHFLELEEKENSIDIKCPFFVSKNGIDLNKVKNLQWEGSETKTLGFLGRLDIHHKGLDILLEAIDEISLELKDKGWKVILHGPDYRGGGGKLEEEIFKRTLQDIVQVSGPLYSDQKFEFLKRITTFIHLSRYEGQPQALLEAIGVGCPVLVTSGTNCGIMVQNNNLGWLVESDPNLISQEIIKITDQNCEELKSISSNSKVYSNHHFSWEQIAQSFLQEIQNLKINN